MSLTDQQLERVIQKFREFWRGSYTACPVCRDVTWEISDSIFGLPEYSDGLLSGRGGASYPVLPVTCGKCGYVIFFNAVKLGFFEMYNLKSEHGE
jgi:hypothetical protein